MGFFNPIKETADSFRINANEYVANSLEKSLPSFIFHPIVFPYSQVTALLGKSTAWLGSFPSQSNPPFVFHTSVVGLPDSAISRMAPEFFKSVLMDSK